MQREKVYCSQNISEAEKEKLQNDNSAVNASSVHSKCNECNHQSINNQVPGSLAVDVKKMRLPNFRYNGDNVECDLMFAENNFEGKKLKNSDSSEEQERNNLRIHTYIGSGKSQNKRCSNSINILKCTLGKVSCKNVEIFNIQNTTIPLITEVLRKEVLSINYDMDYSNYNMNVELILASAKIIDIKPHLTTHVATAGNCPYHPGQDFLYSRDICNVLTGKKLSERKICFHDMLLRGFKAWPSYKDVHKYKEVDIIISCFLLYEILKSKEQHIILEVIPSICNNSNNSDTQINLQAKLLEYKNVTTITNCASFFGIISGLHPTEEKCTRVEKYALYCRKQIQFNMSLNNSWTKNTQSQQIYKTYPSICKENINCTLMKSIIYELHHNVRFSRTVAKKEDSYVLTTEAWFHKQQRKSPKERCVTQYCLLTSEDIEIHNTVSMFNNEGKDMSLVLPADNFDSFCLWKTFRCNTNKIQDPTKIKFRLNYLPAVSQIKIEKLTRKCSNLHKPVVTLKQKKKKKQIKMYNSSDFIMEKLKTLHFILSENKKSKTRVLRNRISFTNEARDFFPKFLRTTKKVSIEKKDYCNCRELPRNCCKLANQKCTSFIFDKYEKIPLSTDSEELDQIQFTKHVKSNNEICIEERKVSSLTNMYYVPDKLNDVLLPGLPPTMVATCSSLLQQSSQRNKMEYTKDIDPHIYYLDNKYKYVNFPASGINFGNISFSGDRQCDTSAFHSGPLPGEDKMKKSGESQCRISLSQDTKIQYEEINSIVQYPAVTNSTVSDNNLYSKTQGEEMTTFSLYEDIQTDSNFGTFNSEPMTMTQNLEYLNEEGEISAKQNYITQKNQKQTEMNGNTAIGLILSHSEDESEICHASVEKLKTHFSIKNNGCLEDVDDSKIKNITDFELKSKYDLVLEELCVFHEISKENEKNISKVETNKQGHSFELNNSEEMEEHFKSISQKKVCISSPVCAIIAGENVNKQNQSSLKEKIARNGGQEEHESCSSDMPDEELLYTPDEACKKVHPWNPAFSSHWFIKEENFSLQKQRGYYLPHEIVRVHPLKTCNGPIRIGLSRKAKTRQLHPYLK
ncbi:PREDICTED: RAD51-associated protein 2 [Gavialis gangeticus]|uniref:RAD51-associated protein 2 n=1 Tax=Gavialis gangeticus TaxID=94835 RepID=UPI00092E3FA5|nr:PREDICTED: RAD51-associated protein 2 [Gavialis gangeticus]